MPKPNPVLDLRNQLGLTQAQLAVILNVHVITVSRWERNRHYPDPRSAARLQELIAEKIASIPAPARPQK